ncbi:MAG: PqqD family protein [Clostridia bacterium]|nr:PqqD family protein [Clostridia bacterium]
MKIKEGYMLRSVAGQNIVVPVGDAALSFNGMISLNGSGAFLWSAMTEDVSRDELVSKLLSEYDVEPQVAAVGVDSFLKKMREAKLLVE